MQKTILFSVLMLCFFSCQKDDCCSANDITGQWEWIQSVGGIGGWTLTPETEGVFKDLFIDDNTYREFEDGQLIFESTYRIETRSDSFFDTNTFIILEARGDKAVKIGARDLIMHDLAFDGFSHSYIRK